MSKAEGRRQRAKGGSEGAPRAKSFSLALSFAFLLLPAALLTSLLPGLPFAREESPAPPRLSEGEADDLLLRAARSALGGREGALLVMDARTGRVRALAGGRAAFEEATPPGSAVKPFTMLAALRTGSLAEGERHSCRRHYRH